MCIARRRVARGIRLQNEHPTPDAGRPYQWIESARFVDSPAPTPCPTGPANIVRDGLAAGGGLPPRGAGVGSR